MHVHEFMTLDGVVDAPTWTSDYGFDPKMGERIGAVTGRSSGILLGRTTYEMFEPAWSTRTVEGDPGRRSSTTRRSAWSRARSTTTWRNSGIVGPYDPDAIRRLKEEAEGDIYVSGSITLVRAMLADGLVDGLHVFVYPLTLGSSLRLFPEGAPPTKLSLQASETYENGVVHLAYRPAGGESDSTSEASRRRPLLHRCSQLCPLGSGSVDASHRGVVRLRRSRCT